MNKKFFASLKENRNSAPAKRFRFTMTFFFIVALAYSAVAQMKARDEAEQASSKLVVGQFLNPRDYPDDERRFVKPPSWDLFGGKTHFTVLRNFQMQDGRLVNFESDLDKNTKQAGLGDVIWPNARFLKASNISDLVSALKKRNLYLYQIWGYVPGSGPGHWTQFRLSPATANLFESQLGDKWLGMDLGEQDGRYLLGYAQELYPTTGSRLAQYQNFLRHIGKISADLGNKMATLTAVNYAHYLVKDGLISMVGSEAAQMHPNNQVFYAFNRGAGKQYGVPWFGNASVYNRWGWKSYSGSGEKFGPTKGASLSLMKRLLYTHILYNAMVAGFEGGWFDQNGRLSPLGRLQQSAVKWVDKHGNPGVMQTSTAVMLDFYSGWIFPAYNNILYRVWGNLPYTAGDYLTNDVFGLIYPGYQESSYFHDERGFNTATPYGDATDALLSDAPQWLLNRYSLLIVGSELTGGTEIKEKLDNYVRQGGHLIITAGSLRHLPGGLAGFSVSGDSKMLPAVTQISTEDSSFREDNAFEVYPLYYPQNSKVLTRARSLPLTISNNWGKGKITVFASAFGIPDQPVVKGEVKREEERPLVNPYPLLHHVRLTMEKALVQTPLFEAGRDLSVVVCRIKKGEYTIGIANNGWTEKTFRIKSNIGELISSEELEIDSTDRTTPGYLPENYEKKEIGKNTATTIAGGDIRIFRVKVTENGVKEVESHPTSQAPHGRILPIRTANSLQDEITARPTFFQHFDGIAVDWKYLHDRTTEALRKDSSYINLQHLDLTVDLSSGINLFPDLRLVNNIPSEYERSMRTIRDVIQKMNMLHANKLLITLHTQVENNMSIAEQWESLRGSLHQICKDAAASGITVYLKLAQKKLPADLETASQLLTELNEPNLKLALNTGLLLQPDGQRKELSPSIQKQLGMWLISVSEKDITGSLWQIYGKISSSSDLSELRQLLALKPGIPCALDAIYNTKDDEYKDIKTLENIYSTIH